MVSAEFWENFTNMLHVTTGRFRHLPVKSYLMILNSKYFDFKIMISLGYLFCLKSRAMVNASLNPLPACDKLIKSNIKPTRKKQLTFNQIIEL